jgi:hypothetical protein
MHACLVPLEKALLAGAKRWYRTSTRKEGQRGDNVSGTDWTDLGEFEFGFQASPYADDVATPMASRA